MIAVPAHIVNQLRWVALLHHELHRIRRLLQEHCLRRIQLLVIRIVVVFLLQFIHVEHFKRPSIVRHVLVEESQLLLLVQLEVSLHSTLVVQVHHLERR